MSPDISLPVALVMNLLAAWQGVWQQVADRLAAAESGGAPIAGASAVAITADGAQYRDDGERPHLAVAGMAVSGRADGQDWRWELGDVIARRAAADPRLLDIELPAPQRFLGEGALGATRAVLWARNLRLRAALDGDGAVRAVAASGEGITLVVPGGEISAAGFEMGLAARADGILELRFAASEIALPQAWRLAAPLDGSLASARLSARIAGLAPAPAADTAGWHAQGGAVLIDSLSLAWGPAALDIEGRSALDESLRPEGRFTVQASGVHDALAAAQGAGLIAPAAANGFARALARIGEMRGGGPADDLRLSFAMAGGTLSWAGLPLATLAPLGVPAPVPDADGCPQASEGARC